MKNEYKLLLLSVLRERTPAEDEELIRLFSMPMDWELIGGQLLNHRLGGYFLSGLSNKELQKKAPRELIKALELLVLAQKMQTLQIIKITKPVFDDLDNNNIRYAALKGAVFNASLYSPGDRRSNDTDLLVFEEDLDKVGEILRSHGYIQTFFMMNGEYKEATRKEKLIQRINYHDLVPFVKLFDNDYLPSHEFDINFHFDSKENDITKNVLDYGTTYYENDYCRAKGLLWETNLAHLSVHFYREASNSLWTERKNDVTLYKLIDIINVLRSCKDKGKIDNWPHLMKKFNLQKAAYFTLHTLLQFYEDSNLKKLLDGFDIDDKSFLDEIKIEGQNRTEKRTESFSESAFSLKR